MSEIHSPDIALSLDQLTKRHFPCWKKCMVCVSVRKKCWFCDPETHYSFFITYRLCIIYVHYHVSSCIIYRQSKWLSCWFMKFARPFWTSGLYVRLFEVIKHSMILRRHGQLNHQWWPEASTKNWNLRVELIIFDALNGISIWYQWYKGVYYIYINKSSTQSRAELKTQLVISATRSWGPNPEPSGAAEKTLFDPVSAPEMCRNVQNISNHEGMREWGNDPLANYQ